MVIGQSFRGFKMFRLLFAFFVSLFALASPAHAWWEKDWSYRKAVTIDTTATGVNVSGPIGRTLVLVRLHSGNFTFTEALENGADIRVVDSDDKSPLPYHIESFDAKTGLATLWVSVPTLNGGEKKQLWLYFGNANAKVGEDVKGSFDADYMAAYHFSEGPGQAPSDKTANANAAQTAPPGVNDSGIIGRSARFPGQGAVTIAASPSLAMAAAAPFTFSAWVKPDQLTGDQAVFARGSMIVGINGGTPYVSIGGASTQASAAIKQAAWSHIGVVADGTTIKIYVNGIEAAAATAVLPAIDGPISIGGAEGRPFGGEIDEARLSKVARPAAMMLAMANAEGPSGKLVAVSESAEKQGSGGGVLFFILGKIHALDAIIIGLCMILLGAALWLMVTKIRYLNKANRGNAVFNKRFIEMHEELVPVKAIKGIDPAEVTYIQASPLGRLYEMGIEELQVRQKSRGTRPLSGEAVEAMRAAVDAVVVDENQKLDKWMVILTIAISGGPFIGLLGTVIGVMSTFGGVAMAGDVNVNAIAPGIAAALLATIAGMACAIPSLFGYNYINSRISSLADEMRVFVDRLITRLAEMQAEAAETPPPLQIAAE
jgi:biopolymer transport protein ExbB